MVFQQSNLAEIFHEVVRGNTERTCLRILKDGESEEQTLSYGELLLRAQELAVVLSKTNPVGSRVLLLFDTSLEFVISFWACVVGGFIAVPVYPPQNQRSQKGLFKIIEDCDCSTLLTTAFFKEKIGWGRWFVSSLRKLNWVLVDANIKITQVVFSAPVMAREDIVLLQYTSGSTGIPKGVKISHENILQNFMMMLKVLDPDSTDGWRHDSLVSWLPLYHDMGLIGGVIFPILAESTATLMSPLFFIQKPVRWLRAISRYKATVSPAPDFAYRYCAKRVTESDLSGLDLSSWTLAINGAEPVRAETLNLFTQKFSVCGFKRSSFFPTYGLAEATILVTGGSRHKEASVLSLCRQTLSASNKAVEISPADREALHFVSNGQVGWQMKVKIVRPDTLCECLDDEVGEILIHGLNVSPGYWNRSDQGKVQIGSDVFFKTGDLGFFNNSELYVTGRSKDLMIVRGKNIYPHDIEDSAESANLEIRFGGVVAFSLMDKEDEKIVVLAELQPQSSETQPEVFKNISRQIAQVLSQDHGLNADLFFVPKGSLLKTSSGKIQRSECKEYFLKSKFKILWGSTLAK